MLSFFQSIFGIEPETPSRYPEHLVSKAVERTVDGTDPRLRAISDYAEELRPAVLTALDHVMDLTGKLPETVELSRAGYRDDPRIAAFFASVEHMHEVIAADPRVTDCLLGPKGRSAHTVQALMVMRQDERTMLGMELNQGQVRKDVKQVTVNFTGHRFEDLSLREDAFRDLLKRRVFDHLLEISLHRIATAREKRGDLRKQQTLLKKKLDALEAGGWGFETPGEGKEMLTESALEARINDIEQQLIAMGVEKGVLQIRLGLIKEVLSAAPQQLTHCKVSLTLDRMGVKRQQSEGALLELELDEIQSAIGRTAIILPVTIPVYELPKRGDMLDKAMRYLG